MLRSRIRALIYRLFNRDAVERSLDEEVRSYVAHSVDAQIQSGMPLDQARRAALMDLGGTEQIKERVRDARTGARLDGVVRDRGFAFRTFAKNPGFTGVAVLTLALGIGANTTIYSFMDSILFRTLPIEDPESLVMLRWSNPQNVFSSPTPIHELVPQAGNAVSIGPGGTQASIFPYPALSMLQRQDHVFSSVFGYRPLRMNIVVDSGDTSGMAQGTYVSGNYFESLGIRPIAGRLLSEDDDQFAAPPAIVLSSALSNEQFGSAEDALGKLISLNSVPFTVVGVAPPAFSGLDPSSPRDFYIPSRTGPLLRPTGAVGSEAGWYQDSNVYWIDLVGRLRPGISLTDAQTILPPVFEQFVAGTAFTDEELENLPDLIVRDGAGGLDVLRDHYSTSLYLLLGMVAVILAIACANVANLLMSRAAARRREIAVRLSLGAGRLRLVRQLLTESVLLAAAGGVLGIALALLGMRVLPLLLADADRGLTLDAELNWQVLTFTAALSLLTGVIFGLAPALRATRINLIPALKELRSGYLVRRTWRHRVAATPGQALVVVQIALSLVLLVGAGLFVGTLYNLRTVDVGFNRERLLLATVNARYVRREAFFRDLREEFRAIPGVRNVSLSRSPPLSGGTLLGYVALTDAPTESRDQVLTVPVGTSFFETMEIPILLGREIDEREAANEAPVAVVDERFREAHFGGRNPVGQYFNMRVLEDEMEGIEIVGVSADVRIDRVDSESLPVVYVNHSAYNRRSRGVTFELRTEGDPLLYADSVRGVVRAADPAAVVTGLRSQTTEIDSHINQPIAFFRLSLGFAAFALLIACIGLYGSASYSVVRRRNEIGIRIALGAKRWSVLCLVLRQVLTLGLVGIAIGLPTALATSRLIGSFLWGIAPNDPLTIAGATGALLIAVFLAGYAPARRALRTDPMVALRPD